MLSAPDCMTVFLFWYVFRMARPYPPRCITLTRVPFRSGGHGRAMGIKGLISKAYYVSLWPADGTR